MECVSGNRPFLLQYLDYRIISRTEFCEFLFLSGPYYLVHTVLSSQINAAATDNLFIIYYAFNKILFENKQFSPLSILL